MATGCVYIDGLRSLARANASTLHELRRHFAAHTEQKAKLQWEADSVTLKRNGTSLRDPAAKAWLLRATAPTSFVTASEIRAKFAGIVFVGEQPTARERVGDDALAQRVAAAAVRTRG